MGISSLQQVQDVVKLLTEKQTALREARRRACYCGENNMDHKGSCHHCDAEFHVTRLVDVGQKVLQMETDEFHIEAPSFMGQVLKAYPKLLVGC